MKRLSRGGLLLRVAWLALLAGHGVAAPSPAKLRLPDGMTQVTSVEGITEYRLTNGLAVLLFPDPSQPMVTVNVTYKVGSRHEGYGETGMAHLLEHLMFKGSPRHPNVPQELTAHGARPNGTTSHDRTNYYETFDANDDNLRWALDLESDRMVNAFIARKDLESEFTVVRNEFESGENNPSSVLYKRMLHAVFNWHNYGNATIGEKSDIEGAPIERLQAFYRMYYQPDNAVLLVTGKFDEQKALDLVHEYFAKIPKPARVLVPTYTREPTQDGERQVTLRRTGDVQLFAAMFRCPPGSHADHAALEVLNNLLTDEPSGRMYQAVVETKKAASLRGMLAGRAEGGVAGFWAEVRSDQSLTHAQTAVLGVLEELKSRPATAEEIAKAKTRLLKDFEMLLKRSAQLGLMLSNYIGQGDWRLAFWRRDALEKVTAADVDRVARFYFKPANRTLGFFLPDPQPDRTEIPRPPEVAAILKDYQGRAALAVGEDFDPSPANIEKRTARGKLGNGLKYALLSKQNRGAAVNATLTFRFGTTESLQDQQIIGSATAAMLDKGTADKTRQQINDLQDQLKARIGFDGGAQAVTATIETDRPHLADAIRLTGELLRQPSFPTNELENLRAESLANLEQEKSNPQALAQILFNRIAYPYPPGDPRRTLTIEEQVRLWQSVTREQVQAFYRRFYGGRDATAAVVGDFDKTEIESVLREVFGQWNSPAPFQRIPNDYQPVASTNVILRTPDKANAVLLAGLGFPMRNDHPDYPALALAGHKIGGGFLNSRLASRIRQKEGLSYSVGGRFQASMLDTNGGFVASAIFNPQNRERLEVAFREEIERAARDGLTEAELVETRGGWLKARKLSRANDGGLAGLLSQYLFLDRTLRWDADFEGRVEELTLEQVNAALRKYLDYGRMIRIEAGDFKSP